LGREALLLLSVASPYRLLILRGLIIYQSKRFEQTGQIADKGEVDSLEREALELESASDLDK
jgi:hypothetical protein